MTESILLICVIVSFFLMMIIGNYLYKKENKKAFNYLNTFPFEMENRNDFTVTLIFRILVIAFISFCSSSSLFLLFFHKFSYLNTRILGVILILISFMILGLFLTPLRFYKAHLVLYQVLNVFTFISYFIFGVIGLINKLYDYPLWSVIVSFIIGSISLLFSLIPQFTSWFKVRMDEGKIIRNKVNILCVSEWGNILLYIGLLVLITLATVL